MQYMPSDIHNDIRDSTGNNAVSRGDSKHRGLSLLSVSDLPVTILEADHEGDSHHSSVISSSVTSGVRLVGEMDGHAETAFRSMARDQTLALGDVSTRTYMSPDGAPSVTEREESPRSFNTDDVEQLVQATSPSNSPKRKGNGYGRGTITSHTPANIQQGELPEGGSGQQGWILSLSSVALQHMGFDVTLVRGSSTATHASAQVSAPQPLTGITRDSTEQGKHTASRAEAKDMNSSGAVGKGNSGTTSTVSTIETTSNTGRNSGVSNSGAGDSGNSGGTGGSSSRVYRVGVIRGALQGGYHVALHNRTSGGSAGTCRNEGQGILDGDEVLRASEELIADRNSANSAGTCNPLNSRGNRGSINAGSMSNSRSDSGSNANSNSPQVVRKAIRGKGSPSSVHGGSSASRSIVVDTQTHNNTVNNSNVLSPVVLQKLSSVMPLWDPMGLWSGDASQEGSVLERLGKTRGGYAGRMGRSRGGQESHSNRTRGSSSHYSSYYSHSRRSHGGSEGASYLAPSVGSHGSHHTSSNCSQNSSHIFGGSIGSDGTEGYSNLYRDSLTSIGINSASGGSDSQITARSRGESNGTVGSEGIAELGDGNDRSRSVSYDPNDHNDREGSPLALQDRDANRGHPTSTPTCVRKHRSGTLESGSFCVDRYIAGM